MDIVKGRRSGAIRTLLYAESGIGKSTFAAGLPSPLFLCVEHGADQLPVDKLYINSWDECLSTLEQCITLDGYETIVVDTLDALENMLTEQIVAKAKEDSINSGNLGYGRGISALALQWRPFLAALDRVRLGGKNVMMIAHCAPKKVSDPTFGEFDQLQPKLSERVWGLCSEYADDVLFATFEKGLKRGENGKRDRAIITGERVVYTTKGSGYAAKNRHNLPPTMPLDAAVYLEHLRASQRTPVEIHEAITALLKRDGAAPLAERVTAAVSKAGNDVQALQRIEQHLASQISQ